MIRQAISPRFAIRIRLNMGWLAYRLLQRPKGAGSAPAIWHAGPEVTIASYSKNRRWQRPV
jgi:hypothetical protein